MSASLSLIQASKATRLFLVRFAELDSAPAARGLSGVLLARLSAIISPTGDPTYTRSTLQPRAAIWAFSAARPAVYKRPAPCTSRPYRACSTSRSP